MRIEPRPLPDTLPDLGDLPPLLTRLYAARGVQSAAELDKSLARLIPYQQLKGIDAAVALLARALEDRQRILFVGDFDADGATASCVGVLGLRQLGAAHVDYLVPNRFEYGYGLTPEIVAVALERQPNLLVTVDNGISSVEGVAAAKAAGLAVLVTDHHLPGPELPAADAIVNPNQPECRFPSKCIAGVGVIFYVLLALRAHLREQGWFERLGIKEPNLGDLLDLVALGSVADVVPLDANNRILVHQGLARIRAGRARPGLRAILEVAGRDHRRITSTDLGFILGPRLNAAGRLDDISLGIECLLCEDEALARDMAVQLDQLNQDRKAIEQGMQREALAQLKDLPLEDLPFGLCLFDPDWHQGVIGILASRLKERYHRPTIAFADAGDGLLKGSARSVPGLHIRDALDAVAAKHPGLISKFGGHAMAAGLSLPQENFGAFAAAFDAEVRRQLCEDDLTGRLLSDGQLSVEEFHLELARALRNAGPWGQHFPEPLFHGVFQLVQQRLVGERHLKLVLRSECGSTQLDGIAFNIDREQWPNPTVRWAELAYKLDVNEYRGQESVQLLIAHIAAALSPDGATILRHEPTRARRVQITSVPCSAEVIMTKLFEPCTLRGLTLPNRIAVSPMCQYSARLGMANDWHLVHLGSRAVGGAGLVIVEATAVTAEGRITAEDLGIWSDEHVEPLRRITRFIEAQGAVAGIQLAHAGRKASTWQPWLGRHGSIPIGAGGWTPVGPSTIAFDPEHAVPTALDEAGIARVIQSFVEAAERSLAAGFKVAEVHAAHGYLLHQFLSPLSNQRRDAYGGSFDNRIRLLLQVTEAVRGVWPDDLPLFVRLSATDWVEDGWNPDETVELARRLKALGVDLIDVSSGGTAVNAEIPTGPGYQTQFAERVRREAGIASGTVGMITESVQAEHILRTGQADLILLARELLRDPYWPLHAADELGDRSVPWPAQYVRAAHRDTPIRKVPIDHD